MAFWNGSPSLDRYMSEIRSIPLVSREEEIELAERCQAGDKNAERKLIRAHLRFVPTVAKIYSWSVVPIEDLISAGNYGLVRAVRRYEPYRNARFISYAVWYIRRDIREEIFKMQHIISSTKERQSELMAIRRALESAVSEQGGKLLSPEQLQTLGITEAQLAEAKGASTHQSLDAPLKEDGESDSSLYDLLETDEPSPDAFATREHLTKTLASLLQHVTEEEATIIRFMHGLEDGRVLTATEVSAIMRVSKAVVNARCSTAMRKMKIAAKAMHKEKRETFFEE